MGERVEGTDFYVDGPTQELGHLHLNGDLHLATPPALGEPLVAAGLARPFPYGGHDYLGWTCWRVLTFADAAHAEWLCRINYDYLRGTPVAELLARIGERLA